MNEVLLLLTVLLYFSMPLVAEKAFGRYGLYAWVVIGSLWMNVEVVKVIGAFGAEMTLGNVLLSSTFLCTDILSEKYGRDASRKAALLGSFAIVASLAITQIMLAFEPSQSDFAQGAMETLFTQMPRLALASFVTYFVVQLHDVWLYHKIWAITEKRFGSGKMLWLRNCGSTIVSQFINAFLFTALAWYGVYDMSTIVSLSLATFTITAVLALADTPFIYASKRLVRPGR